MISFWVSGNPVPKQSYRHSKKGNWQPKRVTDWEETVGWAAKQAYRGEPTDKRYCVRLTFWRKGKRKVDVGNLTKPVLDAMQGIIYIDDEQVDRLIINREYDAENCGVEVVIGEIA